MSADETQVVNTCGCCQAGVSPTPAAIRNRAGLSSLRYRVGTYASFFLAMTEQIAQAPELRTRWLARTDDDFGIALLAMWSYVADILTFYQERIANEAYLRTALLPESVVRLAALLDYTPAPGAAAEADLAFFLELQKQLQIPVGLRVQSVPGPNEKPQKYETVESVTARAELNQLQVFPLPTASHPVAQGSSQAILLSDRKGLAPGVKLAIFDALRAELKAATGLSVKHTQPVLGWAPAIQSTDFDRFTTQAGVYAREFRLFGSNAPSSYVQAVSDPNAPGGVRLELVQESPQGKYANSNLPQPLVNRLALDARYADLKPGSTLLIWQAGSSADPSDSFARLVTVANVTTEQATYGPLQAAVSWLTLGFGLASQPVVALDSQGNMNVFAIGDDGAVWTIRQVAALVGWSSWESLGGQVDRLAVGSNQDGRLEVFARGLDRTLWHIGQLAPSGDWGPWASLGGQIDLLAVAADQDGSLEVFAIGIDSALWRIGQLAPNGDWGDWASLGGRIDLLAVATGQDGRLEVFARGMDRALWRIDQVGPERRWGHWESLGGEIDLLDVGRNQDGRLEVFARGMDQALWHIWELAPNQGWSDWDSLGGQIDLIAVSHNQDGRLEVFARGMNQSLWHIWQMAPNDGWSTWVPMGGLIDRLTAGIHQDGRIEVFARSLDEALLHNWQLAPNDDWSGWGSRGLPMWSITDPGRVTVYEITRLLAFSGFEYGDTIAGNLLYIPLAEISGIEAKRPVILDDDASAPQTVRIQSVQQIDTDGDGLADHWQVGFVPDLVRSLATATATLYGNVCASTHGQTIAGEVLGDGNAAATFQSFRLQKSPVTFVHRPGAPHGVADTLRIQVSGMIWDEVADFFGRGPTERVFVTSQDATGMTVRFGDGVTGSRLPTGRTNVVGTYRQGIGVAGNVAPGALRTLLDRPVGLRSVSNPGPATGGAEPESLDQTRANAPNTVRTFGRIVSLEDFEDAAREFAGVAKAHASWAWNGEEQVVYLTVAGVQGAAITGQTYADLVTDLNSRRDPNRALRVRGYTKVPIRIEATLFVDAHYVADDVLALVQAALTSFFSFDDQRFGQPVHVSDVYAALQGVAGVAGIDITTLNYKSAPDAISHGASGDPAQLHLRIGDAELATLDDPALDAIINLGTSPT